LGLYCLAGNRSEQFSNCSKNFLNFNHDEKPFPSFSPIFVDVTGDLVSEIVFGMVGESGKPVIRVWRLVNEKWVSVIRLRIGYDASYSGSNGAIRRI
jgi:hypothetical protein